ncbi:MAG TPA: hypothetical protein VER79_01160 [Candidatus Limnocylindrales bacterium]|nr:hypothetical protein [Candidatus Limnocylindrales bacterium]
MSRAEAVVEAFYEDPGLRGSLTDDEADVLLRWASAQAERLDATGADDAAFEALTSHLRQLIERLNWTAGEGSYATSEARTAALSAIAANAQVVGLNFTPSFSAQAAPADPMDALTGLLASLEPPSSPPPPADSAPLPITSLTTDNAPPLPPPSPAADEEFHDL